MEKPIVNVRMLIECHSEDQAVHCRYEQGHAAADYLSSLTLFYLALPIADDPIIIKTAGLQHDPGTFAASLGAAPL